MARGMKPPLFNNHKGMMGDKGMPMDERMRIMMQEMMMQEMMQGMMMQQEMKTK